MTPGQMEMIAIRDDWVRVVHGGHVHDQMGRPSVLLAYAFVGMVLYGVMRALGELVYLKPGTGWFADYGLSIFTRWQVTWSSGAIFSSSLLWDLTLSQ